MNGETDKTSPRVRWWQWQLGIGFLVVGLMLDCSSAPEPVATGFYAVAVAALVLRLLDWFFGPDREESR